MTLSRHFSHISVKPIVRFSSGIDELDWLYGCDPGFDTYGVPCGTLSLWGGGQGVGKTRTAMTIAGNILGAGSTVLFFTLEMTESQFLGSYCKDVCPGAKFFISGETELSAHISEIRRLRPTLVVVDSVNKIKGAHSERGRQEIESRYRGVIAQTSSHVVWITQLNAEGGIKGGTYLPHMVDIVFYLEKFLDKTFKISSHEKNRFGQTGIESWWLHDDTGAICTSNHRFEDKRWRKAHGVTNEQWERMKAAKDEKIVAAMQSQGIKVDSLKGPLARKSSFWTDFRDGWNSLKRQK